MESVASTEDPPWVAAANAAAVRLAAEAGAEVDEILGLPEAASFRQLGLTLANLEQGAEAAEVATDLAGLLWAECEAVPPIATILADPALQMSLLAVVAARRTAAERVAERVRAAEERGARPAVPPLYPTMGPPAAFDPARAHLWRRRN